MYTDMDLYAKVRRAVMMDAMNELAAARNFRISRNTAKSIPPHTSQAAEHHTAPQPNMHRPASSKLSFEP